MKLSSVLLAAALLAATGGSVASGRVGVYAIVEAVSFEPAEGPAQRIRIHGAFAFAERHCYDCGFAVNATLPNRPMAFSCTSSCLSCRLRIRRR